MYRGLRPCKSSSSSSRASQVASALDRGLEVGVEVDELAQALGQPDDLDLLLAPALDELLDASVGEVHDLLPETTEAPRSGGPPAGCDGVQPKISVMMAWSSLSWALWEPAAGERSSPPARPGAAAGR